MLMTEFDLINVTGISQCNMKSRRCIPDNINRDTEDNTACTLSMRRTAVIMYSQLLSSVYTNQLSNIALSISFISQRLSQLL